MARTPKTQEQAIKLQEPQIPEAENEQSMAKNIEQKCHLEAEKHIVLKPVTDNEQNRIISRILRQNRQERTMQKYAAKNRKLKQEVARLEQEIQALQKK